MPESKQKSYTHKTEWHEACGYSYMVVRSDGEVLGSKVYRGENAVKTFLSDILQEEVKIRESLAAPKPIVMTAEDWEKLKKAKMQLMFFAMGDSTLKILTDKKDQLEANSQENCKFCEKPLLQKNFRDAVKDHCHITGRYRGAAHNACNLKMRIKPKTDQIPNVFHNLRGYDAHHLMQAMSQLQK